MLITRSGFARAMADHTTAVALLTQITDSTGSAPDPGTLSALITLGDSHRLLGDHRTAHQRLTVALVMAEGLNDRYLRSAVHNALGILAKDAGHYAAASSHYAEALQLLGIGRSGSEQGLLAAVHHNLAGLAHAQGNYHDGEVPARRAIELRVAARGSASEIAADRTVLAAILTGLHRLDEAEEIVQESIATWTGEYGPDHYEVAVNLHDLAAIHRMRGDLAGSQALVLRALAIKRRLLGDRHPEVAALLSSLAALTVDLGDDRTAARLYIEAVGILRQTFGEDHVTTRRCERCLQVLDGGIHLGGRKLPATDVNATRTSA